MMRHMCDVVTCHLIMFANMITVSCIVRKANNGHTLTYNCYIILHIQWPYFDIVTGAKVRQEIYEAFENIYPILKSFKK